MSKTYTTIQGDMWDGIAYKQLGNVKYTDSIMKANTQYRKVYIFSAGIELVIPDVEITVSDANLPPWKQVSL